MELKHGSHAAIHEEPQCVWSVILVLYLWVPWWAGISSEKVCWRTEQHQLTSIIHTRWLKFFGDIIHASLSVDHNSASEPAWIHCPLMEPMSCILLSHSLWQLSLILHLLALDWQRLIVKLRIVKFGHATRRWWYGCDSGDHPALFSSLTAVWVIRNVRKGN